MFQAKVRLKAILGRAMLQLEWVRSQGLAAAVGNVELAV